MIEIDKLILRFIRLKISRIKVRDENYAVQILIKQIDAYIKCLNPNKEIKKLYHYYRLGYNVIDILNSTEFYYKLSPAEFPTLFTTKRNRKSKKASSINDPFNRFNAPEIIIENIPKIRNEFIKAFKKYLAIIELKKWLETKGFEMDVLYNKANNQPSENNPNEEKLWFKVGLLFATGEMDKLLTQFMTTYGRQKTSNFAKIAECLGNKNYRPYISESVNRAKISDKNIFSSSAKLKCISDHCEKNKIVMVDSFKSLIQAK